MFSIVAQVADVLELDEVWSFVFIKTAKYWLWTAICRRTRQIVAFVIGDRSAETCRRLWQKIPKQYRACHTFSDFFHVQIFLSLSSIEISSRKKTG